MVKTTNHDADAQSNAPLDAGSSCSVGWDLSFGARVHTDLSMERGMVAATAKVPLSKALTP